jgi:hypothetical protein
MEELKSPNQISPEQFNLNSIFSAGSIENGVVIDWQSELKELLKDTKGLILNPRRDSWDPTWKQTKDNPEFKEQVLWELEHLQYCDLIVVYIDPNTKSPITLLELGLFASSNKIVVCCPEGFYRKGNVDIVCELHNIPMVDNINELSNFIKKFFKNE